MGDELSQNDPPPGLIDLTLGMLEERLDLDLGRQGLDAAPLGAEGSLELVLWCQ